MASRIWDTFEEVAARNRDRVAIYGLSETNSMTFGLLATEARAIQSALAKHLPPTPCLIATIGNRTAFVPFLLAALRLRAAIVLLDGDALFADVAAIADRLGAGAIIMCMDTALAEGLKAEPLGANLCLVPRVPRDLPQWTHDGREPVVLKMTSGSSDRPRGVVATEGQLIDDGRQIVEAMGITPLDVNLAAIPLSHSYGMGNLVMPLLLQGSPIALRDGFVPREIAHDVHACRVTTFPGVPYIYEHLRRHCLAASLSAVRLLITAGAPISHETVGFYHRTIGCKIHSFYGTTETGGICYDDTDDVAELLTVGRAMPRTSVTLRPSADAEPGTGRVFVRGPAVATGYAALGVEDSCAAFEDGGFLTGDIGSFEPSGRLTLIGRVSRFINVAGRKVDPAEVETVLRSATTVIEARVIGIACETRGEQVVACVRPRDRSLTAADLAAYKVPRQIVFLDGMPVDGRGKLDRLAIERLVGRAR
jgi:long-chain acyl-CoA synthetase